MKKIMLMLAVLSIISGCVPESGVKEMTEKSREPAVQHCVGRSIIELPSSFAAPLVTMGIFKSKSNGGHDEPMDVLVRAGINPAKFSLEVQKRKAELEALGTPTVDILREVKVLSGTATLFRVQRIEDAYLSEIVFLRGTSLVTAKMHSFQEQYLNAEETLMRFAKGVEILDGANSSGKSDGFCLGAVTIDGNFSIEQGSFLFRNGRGMQFEVNVDTYVADDRVPLLERMSGPRSLLKIFNVHHTVYRAGEISAGGMRAQEWLGSAQTTDDANEHAFQFTLETMRPSPSKLTPHISLTFETAQPLEDGSPTKTLISKDDAIQVWDSVVVSLRAAKL